jgi:hypothetical protein
LFIFASTLKPNKMNYAIEILEKEKRLLIEALKGWKSKDYPEAFKEINKRLFELDLALSKLTNKTLF